MSYVKGSLFNHNTIFLSCQEKTVNRSSRHQIQIITFREKRLDSDQDVPKRLYEKSVHLIHRRKVWQAARLAGLALRISMPNQKHRSPVVSFRYLKFRNTLFPSKTKGKADCAATLMLYAYRRRIQAEEVALVNAFGDDYREYERATKMIVLFVW